MKKAIRVLLSDRVHFHERNFKSLFQFFQKNSVNVTNAEASSDLISRFGDYETKADDFKAYISELERLDQKELFSFRYQSLKVFEICKLEFLSFVISSPSWFEQDLHSDSQVIFDHAFEFSYRELLLNMASAMYWIDWWEQKFARLPLQHYICLFSGSLTYAAAVMQLTKRTPSEVMVLESFFTGNEYYCEKKWEHLPNNSDLQFSNVYRNIEMTGEFNREKIKATNKIILAKNKNVVQPASLEIPDFGDEKKVLFLGQVLSDFSLLGSRGRINQYVQLKEIIQRLLNETTYTMIFKAHPWERVKHGRAITLEAIEAFVQKEFPGLLNKRVYLLEDINLHRLFSKVDYAVTLCSQAGIEAAFHGLKPVQLLRAFYGGKGFTSDYEELDRFIDDLKLELIPNALTLDDFDKFEEFCVKTLFSHLVCIDASGVSRLEVLFKLYDAPPLTPEKSLKTAIGERNKRTDQVSASNLNAKKQLRFAQMLKIRAFSRLSKIGLLRIG